MLAAAVYDPEIRAAVEEATIVERLEEPEDALVSNPRILREATPADYVAAITARLDKFPGLSSADVTEEAVAALLTTEVL